MARIITVVQTYFEYGTYRNNTVELQIPIDAAKLIEEYWKKQGIHNCATAKYLATNQGGSVYLKQDETLLSGINNIGLTFYINSRLQILFYYYFITEILKYIVHNLVITNIFIFKRYNNYTYFK